MIRQDYLMRMIDQFVKALAKILFNKQSENYNDALTNIDDAFKTIVGLDYDIINRLSANDIIALLGISKDESEIKLKCVIIAKLLKEKTDLAKQNSDDNPDSLNNYQKALSLYLYYLLSNHTETNLGNYHSDVKEILEYISDEMPVETRFSLFKYYELFGEYDKAEDELFKLKNLNYPHIEETGILFFKMLEKLNDEELSKGNFTKEEITQGLQEFVNDTN